MKTNMDIVSGEFGVRIPEGTTSWRIEKAIEASTAEMNSTPLKVNHETWKHHHSHFSLLFSQKEEECRFLTQISDFRPNAAADCVDYLQKRGFQFTRKGKSGAFTCDKNTLAAAAALGIGEANVIIEAREALTKLGQVESWRPFAEAGEVQATWNPLGTPMGRYSCDSPNLQNRITEIRETVEARDGYQLISLDLGQAEYVTWASLSGDPILSQSFIDGTDFHAKMASEVLCHVPEFNLRDEPIRQFGKTLNFALLYLMTDFALAGQLHCSVETARKLIAVYEARADVAVLYRNELLKKAAANGYVSTHFGRTRFMPELQSARTRTERHTVNKTAWHHHNAGTGAELLKIRQAKVSSALRKEYATTDVRFALQMHDEIILECRTELVDKVRATALERFSQPTPGFLPFRIDCRVGKDWLSISK
jgi:DNA polymerase I-like protein with 3'-5' exonuclease and polymerase domains